MGLERCWGSRIGEDHGERSIERSAQARAGLKKAWRPCCARMRISICTRLVPNTAPIAAIMCVAELPGQALTGTRSEEIHRLKPPHVSLHLCQCITSAIAMANSKCAPKQPPNTPSPPS